MYPYPPEERLLLARQKQAQLIREAELRRIEAAVGGESAVRAGSRLLASALGAFRARIAAVWGAIPGRAAPCEEPCRDGAAG